MKPSPCDSPQEMISALTDDGLPFPEPIERHIASCPDCAAFARICREGTGKLSAPLPSAGDDLRQKVLRLPADRSVRPRFPIASLSAAAAGILLAAAWWFTRPAPEAPIPPPVVKSESEEAAMEIAALKDDFDQALGHLAEPLAVFSSLARP